jgi:hypothetical protein
VLLLILVAPLPRPKPLGRLILVVEEDGITILEDKWKLSLRVDRREGCTVV